MKFEDVDLSGPPRVRPTDPPVPMLCVRRITLDVHLVEAAREAGVDLRLHTRVTGLLERGGRVRGVRVTSRDGRVSDIGADLVVGADGRLSTIARLTGARRYHVTSSERMSTWAYFRGVKAQPVARVYYHRLGDDFVVAAPADHDLFITISCPSLETLDDVRADSEGSFQRTIQGCPPVAALLEGAERVTKFRGLTRFEGFFREAAGPGWVLAGDSGHFKDPTPGQGISDALRQVERLSEAILRGFSRPADRDEELRRWWRWRDADAIQHYWFANDIGKAAEVWRSSAAWRATRSSARTFSTSSSTASARAICSASPRSPRRRCACCSTRGSGRARYRRRCVSSAKSSAGGARTSGHA